MKKLSLLILGLLTLLPAKADEGMWTLYNLPQAVYDQMKAYGFSLPYENIYSSQDAIKGSVVLFGGFCSGVVVSPDGLVFTNHHCGFEAIRSHSTVEHDYMLNGFYAKEYKDELPNENLFVSFMVEQQDVTARLKALGIDDMPSDRQSAVIDSVATVMTDSVKKVEKTLHVDATSACSAYTPTPRPTVRRSIRSATCPTVRRRGRKCRLTDTRTATSP